MKFRIVEDEISQAAELLESAYANVITQSKGNGVRENVDSQKAVQTLSRISSICRRLEREIREYSAQEPTSHRNI